MIRRLSTNIRSQSSKEEYLLVMVEQDLMIYEYSMMKMKDFISNPHTLYWIYLTSILYVHRIGHWLRYVYIYSEWLKIWRLKLYVTFPFFPAQLKYWWQSRDGISSKPISSLISSRWGLSYKHLPRQTQIPGPSPLVRQSPLFPGSQLAPLPELVA